MNRLLGIALITLLSVMSIFAQPAPCDATDGKGVVKCVSDRYPEKLVAGVSLEQRQANMAFLRDRVIETARCAKLDVGLNCKRGNCNNISHDFIAWKVDGRVEGVDIAAAYDDVSAPLRLMWHTYGPPNYGFPTFKPYGPVSCIVDPPPPPQPDPVLELRARVVELETMFRTMVEAFNNNANALNALISEFTTEQQNRKAVDDEHNRLLDVLKSREIPDGCKAVFGCRLTFNAPEVK